MSFLKNNKKKIVIVLILLIIGYFIYRYWRKNKEDGRNIIPGGDAIASVLPGTSVMTSIMSAIDPKFNHITKPVEIPMQGASSLHGWEYPDNFNKLIFPITIVIKDQNGLFNIYGKGAYINIHKKVLNGVIEYYVDENNGKLQPIGEKELRDKTLIL